MREIEIKDADKGRVDVVFATMAKSIDDASPEVIDRDGDITAPGAFEDGAQVRVSAYGHASWGPSRGASFVPIPPIGRGAIKVDGSLAIAETQFFLKTASGRDTFELVKEMGDLQEWSYGYDILESAKPTAEQKKAGAQQVLVKQLVHEVSPVLLGAGVGTHTRAIKSSKQLDSDLREALLDAGRERYGSDSRYVWTEDFDVDEGFAIFCISEKDGESRYLQVSFSRSDDGSVELKDDDAEVERDTVYVPKSRTFPDEAEHVLGGVRALVSRAEGWGRSSQAKEGRVLSTANRERLGSLVDALGEASAALQSLLTESDPNKNRSELEHELMRFERLRATSLTGGL